MYKQVFTYTCNHFSVSTWTHKVSTMTVMERENQIEMLCDHDITEQSVSGVY